MSHKIYKEVREVDIIELNLLLSSAGQKDEYGTINPYWEIISPTVFEIISYPDSNQQMKSTVAWLIGRY